MKRTALFYYRILAIVLNIATFVFWGAFFLEHLSPFFNAGGTLPAEVWFIQICHFFFLIGLLLSIKWNFAGALLTFIFSFLFLWQAAGYFFFILFPLSNLGTLLWFGIALYNFRNRNKANNTNIINTEQL